MCWSLSRARLFETPWTAAHQAPLSMGFSRQRYWSSLPFPSSEDLPDPGFEPGSSALHADSLLTELPEKTHSEYSGAHIFFKLVFLSSLVKYFGGEELDHMVVLFLIF